MFSERENLFTFSTNVKPRNDQNAQYAPHRVLELLVGYVWAG
jgi:hypothetical protein